MSQPGRGRHAAAQAGVHEPWARPNAAMWGAPRYVVSSHEEACTLLTGMRRSGTWRSRPLNESTADRSGPSTGCSTACSQPRGGGGG